MRAAITAALLASVALGACGAATEPTRYSSVEEMRDRMHAGGLECELEYEGLEDSGRIISTCVAGGEQILLTIWKDPSVLEQFIRSGSAGAGVAYGANWTVETESAELASRIASELGGETTTAPG